MEYKVYVTENDYINHRFALINVAPGQDAKRAAGHSFNSRVYKVEPYECQYAVYRTGNISRDELLARFNSFEDSQEYMHHMKQEHPEDDLITINEGAI